MRTCIIEQTDGFTLERGGNGLTYLLTNKAADAEIFFQGDDALTFEIDYEATQRAYERPGSVAYGKPWNWSLGYLWSNYSDAARPFTSAVERA